MLNLAIRQVKTSNRGIVRLVVDKGHPHKGKNSHRTDPPLTALESNEGSGSPNERGLVHLNGLGGTAPGSARNLAFLRCRSISAVVLVRYPLSMVW